MSDKTKEPKSSHDAAMKAFDECFRALKDLSGQDRKRVLYSTAVLLRIPVQPMLPSELLP